MSDMDKEFQEELERAESEEPDDTHGPKPQERLDPGILDLADQPVHLNFFLILETPVYSVTPTGVLGGEDVPLIRYAGQGFWMTPEGRVRVKDVWDVRPARGQGPFKLMVPWEASASLLSDPTRSITAVVLGWNGMAWLTDQGLAKHVEAPAPIRRTIDDDWSV